MRAFRARLVAELEERSAVKILVDIRDATLLVGAEERAKMTSEAIAMPVSAPVGYVVAPEQWQLMYDHCMDIAETGRTRMMFCDLARGMRWAGVGQVTLVSDWQRRRRLAAA